MADSSAGGVDSGAVAGPGAGAATLQGEDKQHGGGGGGEGLWRAGRNAAGGCDACLVCLGQYSARGVDWPTRREPDTEQCPRTVDIRNLQRHTYTLSDCRSLAARMILPGIACQGGVTSFTYCADIALNMMGGYHTRDASYGVAPALLGFYFCFHP